MSQERRLYPEDQAKVDEFLRTGYNDVERKPFRPLYMMLLLTAVTFGLSGLAIWITHEAGISW